MEKRRILSLLLAATLTVSSLPFCISAQEMQETVVYEDNLLDDALWRQESGDDIAKIAGSDTGYIRVSNLATYTDAARYNSGTVNTGVRIMPAGSYKITMKLRSVPAVFEESNTALAAGNMDLSVYFKPTYKSGGTSSFEISNWGQIKASAAGYANGAFYWPDEIDTADADSKIDTFVRNSEYFKYTYGSCIRITSEWQEYTMFVKLPSEAYKFAIDFRTFSGAEDIVPFDIADLSVIRVESFDDSAVDGIAKSYTPAGDAVELTGADGCEWSALNGATVTTGNSDSVYYHSDIPASGTDTVISADKSVTLAPGKYALGGKFRLGTFDIKGDNTATLEVAAKNSDGMIASFNLPLTNSFTEKTLEFDLAGETKLDSVEFRVSGKLVCLDFADLLLSKIIPPPDEEVSVESVTGEDDDYISVSNLSPYTDVVSYTSGAVSMPAGSYKITMKLRSAPAVFAETGESLAAGNMDLSVYFRPYYKNGGLSSFEISNWGQIKASAAGYANGAFYWPDEIDTADADTKINTFVRNSEYFKYNYGSCIRITPEWQEYTMFVNLANEANKFTVDFRTGTGAEDIVPFDIDDLSVIRVASFDDSEVDGIAKSYTEDPEAALLMGASGEAWTASNGASIDTDLKETDYFHTDAPTTGVNTVITYGKALALVPGKYSIKAKYRLGAFDTTDNTPVSLAVSVNSSEGTTILSSSLAITGAWTELYKEFVVNGETSISDILLRVNNGLVALDFTDVEIELLAPYVEIEGWEGNGGPFELVSDTFLNNGSDYYISISNLSSGKAGARYYDASTAVNAGSTYKFSVWMRTVKHTEIPDDFLGIIEDGKMNLNITMPKVVDENAGNLDLSNSAMVSTYANGTVLTNNFHTTSPGQKSALLTEEWQEYSLVFTPDRTAAIDLTFRRFDGVGGEDIIPFDIDGLSIVLVEPDGNGGYTEIGGNLIKSDFARWSSAVGASVTEIKKTSNPEYTLAKAPVSGNTEIYCTEDEILTPGRYEIIGTFRIDTFDLGEVTFTDDSQSTVASFGKNGNVKLSLFANDVELETRGGSSYYVTNTWSEAVFVLELATEIPMSSLKFMLDANLDLAFKDISITQTERFINLSDVGSGFIMALLMLKHDQAYNFTQMVTVNPVLDEAAGTVGAEDGAKTNEYIHVSNLNNPQSGVRYRDPETKFVPGKTYAFTAWMRSAPIMNEASTEADVVDDGKMNLNVTISQVVTQNAGNLDVSNAAMLNVYANGKPLAGTFYTGDGVQKSIILGTEWVEYKAIFTAGLDGEINVAFRRFPKGGEDTVPFDIDGLSIVEVLENGEYGPNLIKDDESLWSEVNDGKLTRETESAFYRSIGGLRLGKDMVGAEKDTVAPGKYAISADFRLTNVDFSKVAFAEDKATVSTNENSLALRATLFDGKLYTDKKRESVYITNEWNRGTFILNVTEETPINEVRFITGTKLEIDFCNIEMKYLGEPEVKDPNEETIARPEPLPAIREGNLIEGAMTANNLPYWFTNGQKLTSKKASDGTYYLSASDIKNNTDGFTYEPGYTIMPGTYRFVGEFRTTNKGDTSIARVIVGGVSASTLIDNDWSKIDVVFAVNEECELSLKIRGGPVSLNIQDYEMRNLRIIDANTITATSPFEDGNTTEYIHVSNLEKPNAGISYLDKNITFKAGSTYKVTVWMRSMPMVGADTSEGDVVNDGKMNLNVTIPNVVEENAGNLDISNEAMLRLYANGRIVAGDFYIDGPEQKSMVLSEEWTPYSTIFTAEVGGYIQIAFKRFPKGGEDTVPFDIAGLSLVEIKENGTFGANLIKPGADNWTTREDAAMIFEEVDSYESASGSITLSKSLAKVSNISKGKYTVSAKVRLANVDVSKITFAEDGCTIAENANKAACSVRVMGTVQGEACEITNEWTKVSFAVDAAKALSIGDITISVSDNLDFDICDVKIVKN